MISTTKINTYNNLKTTVDIFNTNIIVIVAVMKTSSGSKSRYNKSNMYSNSNNVIMTVLAETIETMVLVI